MVWHGLCAIQLSKEGPTRGPRKQDEASHESHIGGKEAIMSSKKQWSVYLVVATVVVGLIAPSVSGCATNGHKNSGMYDQEEKATREETRARIKANAEKRAIDQEARWHSLYWNE